MKNLNREQLLISFLHKKKNLSSSGLQIDHEDCLYASGEMIAAWRFEPSPLSILFIDCGSKFVCNRRQVFSLRLLAEREGIVYVPYNEYAYPISREFKFVERMVTYEIWGTPKDVNPINIFKQAQKVLDKAVEKAISLDSIHTLTRHAQHVATLFSFEFDAARYETARKQQEAVTSAAKAERIEWHKEQIKKLEAVS